MPSQPSKTSANLCPYFLHNVCRFGDKCRLTHDVKNAPLDNICRYYQFGVCSYGDMCRYRHVKLKKTEAKPDVGLGVPKSFSSDIVSVQQSSPSSEKPEEPKQPQFTNFAEVLKSRLPANKAVICPFYQMSGCCDNPDCKDIHGSYCVVCQEYALDPDNSIQRAQHEKACNEKFEELMEEAFAIQLSADKVCSICLETVIDKSNKSKARFGLLHNCDHVFCLSCIRKWRAAGNAQLTNRVVKACPECRITSDFVTPSPYWYGSKEEKLKIINGYQKRISSIDCTYFNFGKGHCPFADKCFYRHIYEDGKDAKLGEPGRTRAINADGEIVFAEQQSLYDCLRMRDLQELCEDVGNLTVSDYQLCADLLFENEMRILDPST
ncbi:hypothetical protein GJ496_009886 [Pomphorhynchus laevis]|nr:hypothetical protein GJ496_009886 [Pomphorhynchus laevis]